MSAHAALLRFMQARSDVSERACAIAGADLCAYLTDLLDEALAALSADVDTSGFAVVAVGGYGRREQARHSDVDVMLLVERGAEDRAKRVLYPLWDAALKVGHSVRTVPQVTEAAKANVETFTALLDARLVAGDDRLYAAFEDARRRFTAGAQPWLRAQLAERRAALVAREPWQLL
ncbi:MAG: hypothetical protein CVU47_03340, partial [Chloroflexi bacterium HGW-Chloroflexi-9]